MSRAGEGLLEGIRFLIEEMRQVASGECASSRDWVRRRSHMARTCGEKHSVSLSVLSQLIHTAVPVLRSQIGPPIFRSLLSKRTPPPAYELAPPACSLPQLNRAPVHPAARSNSQRGGRARRHDTPRPSIL